MGSMVWQTAAAAASFVAVVVWRISTGDEAPGDISGQTLQTIVVAALMNVLVEFVKRWRSREEKSKEKADGAEVIVDAAGKLVTTQNANLDRFAEQVLRLDARLKAQDDRIDKLQSDVTERDEKIDEQDRTIENLKRDNSAQEDWVRRLTNNQEANIARIRDLDKEISALKREREQANALHAEDKAKLTAELRALSSGIDQLTAQLRQLGHTPAWERSNGAGG